MNRTRETTTLAPTAGTLVILDREISRPALAARLRAAWAATEPAVRVNGGPTSNENEVDRTAVQELPDAELHLQTLTVPQPGDMSDVLALVAVLSRPSSGSDGAPLEVTVINGLEGGRTGLYLSALSPQRASASGMSSFDLMIDEGARPPAPSADELPVEPSTAPTRRRVPGTVSLTVDLTRAAPAVASMMRALANTSATDTMSRGIQRSLDVATVMARQAVTPRRLSPLPAARTAISKLAIISVPGARTAALRLGGSRHDLVVAAAAAGLGRYHERLGLDCPTVRVALPATRQLDLASRSWFSPTLVDVPTDPDHPGPQFGVVADRMSWARRESRAAGVSLLNAAVTRVPSAVRIPAPQSQDSAADLAVTTARGLPGTAHICGAAVEATYPIGARFGSLMSLAAFGNGDRLDIGVALDPAAVTQPALLMQCLVDAFAAYVSAGSGTTALGLTDPTQAPAVIAVQR